MVRTVQLLCVISVPHLDNRIGLPWLQSEEIVFEQLCAVSLDCAVACELEVGTFEAQGAWLRCLRRHCITFLPWAAP